MANAELCSRMVAMDILFPFEHAVFCVKNIFPFPLSITRLLGNYFYNTERAGNNAVPTSHLQCALPNEAPNTLLRRLEGYADRI